MVKLLRLYAKDNKSLVMTYFLISCISIFADALLLISLEAIIDSSLNETTINLILIYFICFLAQLFNGFILKQILDVSLLNWMRKQLASNIIRVPKTNYEVQPQTLHDIQLEKISTFINSLFSSLIRLISFIILNITIILNNNLVASSLLIFMFLITIISVFYK